MVGQKHNHGRIRQRGRFFGLCNARVRYSDARIVDSGHYREHGGRLCRRLDPAYVRGHGAVGPVDRRYCRRGRLAGGECEYGGPVAGCIQAAGN